MARIVVEFSGKADKELRRLSELFEVDKGKVIRQALSLYSFVVDELTRGRKKRLALMKNQKVIAIIAVPGLGN
jgi:hypothetical protein